MEVDNGKKVRAFSSLLRATFFVFKDSCYKLIRRLLEA